MIDKNYIKDNVKISNVLAAEGYDLEKINNNQYKTYCLSPEHIDNNPSLQISEDKHIYKCFSCGIGGDIINILEYIRPDLQNFRARLLYINNYIGDNKENSSLLLGQKKNINFQDDKDFVDIMNYINKYYISKLTKDIKETYIISNKKISYTVFKGEIVTMSGYGLSEKIIKDYKIGYSPNNKELFNLLYKKYDKELINKTGLFSKNGMPNFRNRIIIPYIINGNAVYFTARQTEYSPKDNFNLAKYINQSIENKYIYNEIDLENICIFITEGIFDTLALKNIGYNSIALCGTSLKGSLLKNLICGLEGSYLNYIILDNDKNNAGLNGALKLKNILKANGIIDNHIIQLPLIKGKKSIDINEYLGNKKKEDLIKLLSF